MVGLRKLFRFIVNILKIVEKNLYAGSWKFFFVDFVALLLVLQNKNYVVINFPLYTPMIYKIAQLKSKTTSIKTTTK